MADITRYQIAMSMLKGITIAMAQAIVERAGSEQAFFQMTPVEVANILQFPGHAYCAADYRQQVLARADDELKFVQDKHIRCLYFANADYPQLLAQCDDAPVLLYALGTLDPNQCVGISVVGTRHATAYGISFTQTMVEGLAREVDDNIMIVSGLAYGIDVAAHRTALRAKVPTVAVLAHGLDTIYPATHRNDASTIVHSDGLLLTEYPHGTEPHRGNFLARNRIVAGLSQATVVVESPMRSGSLSTARLAGEYNRDVFAVPGRITDLYSQGCNALIGSQKALLITGHDDIIKHMRWPRRDPQTLFQEPEATFSSAAPKLTPQQQQVVDTLRHNGTMAMSKLSLALNIPVAQLRALLTHLELLNQVRALPGGAYEAI